MFAGVQNPDKLTTLQIAREGPRTIIFNTSLGSVAGVRLSWGRIVGFEQSLALSPHFLDSHFHAFNIQDNLVVNAPPARIVPYGTAGVGLVATWGDSQRDIGTKFMFNYGGGLKFKNLVGPIGLRLDLRRYTLPNVLINFTGQEPSFPKPDLNFLEGTVGVFLSW